MKPLPVRDSNYASEIQTLKDNFRRATKLFIIFSIGVLTISTLVFSEVYGQSDF